MRPEVLGVPARAGVDADDPLAAYNKRQHPPMGVHPCHRSVNGGAERLWPDKRSVLGEWTGFASDPAGAAPDLATAHK